MGGGNASFLIALSTGCLSPQTRKMQRYARAKKKQGHALLFPIPELLLEKEK